MIIYDQEKLDGIENRIIETNSIAYASQVEKFDTETRPQIKHKAFASIDDSDLYYVQSILVSSSWNKNDDIFDKNEIWLARKTPEDKPTNLEHDENLIIGHITSNWTIDDDGNLLPEDIGIEDLPEKFHIVTGSVIYKAFSSPELRDRSEKLIAEIEEGNKYVSMECYFKGFDYGLINKVSGEFKVLERNEETSFLTKYLRAYGGTGEHQEHKIGRVLRNITFSGKGFVDKPANPDSIIFSKDMINKNLAKQKNDYLLKSGVIQNKPITHAEMENIIMSENIEKQVSEINTKLDTVSASFADQLKEAKAFASELENTNETLLTTNQKLEADMKEKEQAITEANEALVQANEALESFKASSEEALAEKTREFEEAAKKWNDEKEAMKKELESKALELDAANEVLAEYKLKEEEMAKKEKMMKRKASLVEAGLEEDAASAAVEKFEKLDDESFDAMTSILAAMKPLKKKEEEDAMMNNPKMMKKMASEDETEAALENVEAEEDINLSVGNDESAKESTEASIRSELIEFVSARLSKNSK